MTGLVVVLLAVVAAELMVRQGFAPLKTLGQAAAGELVLK